MILLELLRNGYGASHGAQNSAAIIAALYALRWNEALAKGKAAADALVGESGDTEAYVLQSTFAAEIGWTYEELQTFLNDGRYDWTPEGGMEFEKAWDAYNSMAEQQRKHRGK